MRYGVRKQSATRMSFGSDSKWHSDMPPAIQRQHSSVHIMRSQDGSVGVLTLFEPHQRAWSSRITKQEQLRMEVLRKGCKQSDRHIGCNYSCTQPCITTQRGHGLMKGD